MCTLGGGGKFVLVMQFLQLTRSSAPGALSACWDVVSVSK